MIQNGWIHTLFRQKQRLKQRDWLFPCKITILKHFLRLRYFHSSNGMHTAALAQRSRTGVCIGFVHAGSDQADNSAETGHYKPHFMCCMWCVRLSELDKSLYKNIRKHFNFEKTNVWRLPNSAQYGSRIHIIQIRSAH